MKRTLNIIATTNANRVRAFCIKHNYYTDGNNDQYRNLLEYVDKVGRPLSEGALRIIAGNIVSHSVLNYVVDDEDSVKGMTVVDYMEELILNECCWLQLASEVKE